MLPMSANIAFPDYDNPKEVYAVFGLTFYWAQVLEQGVLNLAVALRVAGNGGFDWHSVAEFYSLLERKTFGNVLKLARQLTAIPNELDDELGIALDRRNYLAHQFFVERAPVFQEKQGRRQAVDDLLADMQLFKDVDRKFDPIWREAWNQLGVTEEHLERLQKALDSSPNALTEEITAIAVQIARQSRSKT
ncbi:hypothetical protein Pan44_36970 [Caulifigura coniformis]|uniref:Uncharacterized protein n=1 Tax=Caulifigura coniformis TaxID=2527983 RepID=A0A517SHQ9_9PLAN|nr:hypothetical protein [Caulifigura coniformis]QDT55651.1 hypothetical protein Pan44_36970 [Caulifigura coniformis]